jgi:hypothetical protein
MLQKATRRPQTPSDRVELTQTHTHKDKHEEEERRRGPGGQSPAAEPRLSESRLEGVDRRKLKFTTLNTLQAGVSVRINVKSEREGKTNQLRK